MKKIICLLIIVFICKNTLAGPWFIVGYTNYTQNVSYTAPMGYPAVIVPANIGDSVLLWVSEDCSGYVNCQWYFNGDTLPGPADTLTTIITQAGNFCAHGGNGNFLFCLNSFPGQIYGSSYNNYSQNDSASSLYPFANMHITANTGDSVALHVWMNCGFGIVPPYNWYFNGTLIPNTADSCDMTVIITQSGIYSARTANCLFGGYMDFKFYVNNITGIASVKSLNFLDVFPTSVNTSITIQLNTTKPNDVEISFYNMNGRQLKNTFYKNVLGEFIKNENTQALSRGIYFIRIKAGDEVMNKKFLKM